MATPFSAFANATITFKIPDGPIVTDAYGNDATPLVDWEATAMLNQQSKPTNSEFQSQFSQETIYVEGRLIEPKTLPSTIQPEQIGTASIDGIDYEFRYLPAIASSYFAENSILGQKLRGYLTQTTAWGSKP